MLNILSTMLISPVTLLGLSIFIAGRSHLWHYFEATAISTLVFSLYQYKYHKNNSNNEVLFNISLFIISIELIMLCKLSFIWLCLLFISILSIHSITTNSKSLLMKPLSTETSTCATIDNNTSATTRFAKPKLVINLSSYEAIVFLSIWSHLLYRFTERMYIIMSNNTYNSASSNNTTGINEYSIEQCMNIVEIFTTAILLILMCSEVLIHIFYTILNHFTAWRWGDIRLNFLIQSKGFIHNPRCSIRQPTTSIYANSIYIDLIILFSTMLIIFIYVIQPQLNEYNINNIFIWLVYLIFRKPGYWELYIIVYWIVLIAFFIFSAYYIAKSYHWPRTCLRKIFHLLVVLLFTPTIMNNSHHCLFSICSSMNSTYNSSMYSTYCRINSSESYVQSRSYRWYVFIIFSLGIAINLFVLFEYMRLRILSSSGSGSSANGQSMSTKTVQHRTMSETLAYFGTILDEYMELFVTTTASADRSKNTRTTSAKTAKLKALELSHISLLFGCAAPIWLYTLLIILISYSSSVGGSSYLKPEQILLLSIVPYVGLITLGIGDAAAAVIGKLYGSYYWHYLITTTGNKNRSTLYQNNKRTLEGSLACLTSMCIYTFLVLYYEYNKLYEYQPLSIWVLLNVATIILWVLCIVTIVEAWTLENDNIILPILMCVLLLLCSIICF